MAYLHTPKLIFPLEKYILNSYHFKQDCTYNNVRWGIHLGEDVKCLAGTKIISVGRGRVVYSALHAGTKGNLHFSIYVGPWEKKVLSGYWKKGDKRTVLAYWKEPTKFINDYEI